jgi:hypothetical protein
MNPVRIADEANESFIKLARSLMYFFAKHDPARSDKATKIENQNDTASGQQVAELLSTSPPSPDEQSFYVSLAKRVEQILDKSKGSLRPLAKNINSLGLLKESDDSSMAFRTHHILRNLFHHQAEHRLAAVRWIDQQKFNQAIPILEGVFSIEENHRVRNEMVRVLKKLKNDL